MNDNQELLLIDSPPNTPKPPRLPTEEDDLLLDEINQEVTQAKQPFFFPQKIREQAQETWPSSTYWSKQTTFFLQEESSDQQIDPTLSFAKTKKYLKSKQQGNSCFPYYSLMKKLELAYRIIQQKEKSTAIPLFTSVKHIKSISQYEDIPQKALKTQRTPKQEAVQADKKNNNWKKYSIIRKSVTEPDENTGYRTKTKQKGVKTSQFCTNRIINQVDQKQSPLLKGKREAEKQRTKEQFLASMTNWQERRRLKQIERMEKERTQLMNGVTFTPAINPKSKLLMKKKGNMLPIYERQTKPKRLGEVVTPQRAMKAKK